VYPPEVAARKGVRLLVDAEQTYMQPAIDHIALLMMQKYNTEQPYIFNSYQCYLKDAPVQVNRDMERAQRQVCSSYQEVYLNMYTYMYVYLHLSVCIGTLHAHNTRSALSQRYLYPWYFTRLVTCTYVRTYVITHLYVHKHKNADSQTHKHTNANMCTYI